MRCVLACVSRCWPLAASSRPTTAADALAADPVRLKALRAQCAADRQATGEDACRAAAEAFRRRFSGQAGPDEYQTLADLPPIPPSFEEPADGMAPADPAEPEDTP